MQPDGAVRSRSDMSRCFVAASAGTCASTGMMWMQPLLMHFLVAERGWTEAAAGSLITTEMMTMAVGSMMMARFCSRRRAQVFALGGMAVAIAASALSLFVNGPLLFLVRAAVGMGLGATVMVSNIVSANFPDPDKTFARVGVINLLFGAVMVGAYARYLHVHPGATPFEFLLVTLVVLVLPMAVLPSIEHFDQGGFDHAQAAPDHLASMRRRTILLAGVTAALIAGSGTLWALYAIIGQQIGLSPDGINQAITVSITTGFIGMLLPAVLGSRAGRVIPFAGGALALAGAVAVLTSHPSVSAFNIAVCVNVTAVYFIMPYLSGAAAAIDGGGKAAAYVASAFYFASAAAPLIGGVLVTTVGVQAMGFAIAAIAAISIPTFIRIDRAAPRTGGVSSILPPPTMDAGIRAIEGIVER